VQKILDKVTLLNMVFCSCSFRVQLPDVDCFSCRAACPVRFTREAIFRGEFTTSIMCMHVHELYSFMSK